MCSIYDTSTPTLYIVPYYFRHLRYILYHITSGIYAMYCIILLQASCLILLQASCLKASCPLTIVASSPLIVRIVSDVGCGEPFALQRGLTKLVGEVMIPSRIRTFTQCIDSSCTQVVWYVCRGSNTRIPPRLHPPLKL